MVKQNKINTQREIINLKEKRIGEIKRKRRRERRGGLKYKKRNKKEETKERR